MVTGVQTRVGPMNYVLHAGPIDENIPGRAQTRPVVDILKTTHKAAARGDVVCSSRLLWQLVKITYCICGRIYSSFFVGRSDPTAWQPYRRRHIKVSASQSGSAARVRASRWCERPINQSHLALRAFSPTCRRLAFIQQALFSVLITSPAMAGTRLSSFCHQWFKSWFKQVSRSFNRNIFSTTT